jgi:flagellar basal-body rod protein FlgB
MAMSVGSIGLLSMLKTRMHWQQARQEVLAQDVANIDTPGFQPTDLKPLDFGGTGLGPGSVLRLVETDPQDLQPVRDPATAAGFADTPMAPGTSLEDQLMQVSQNASEFRLVSALYSAGLGLIRTAAGGSS